jgi:hypothetical protein
MNLSPKYVIAIVSGFALILIWNAFLIVRDTKLLKAYDACTQFTHHPDCPYSK